MTNLPEVPVDDAQEAATAPTACRECGSTEFGATETYALTCWIDEEDPNRLLCEQGDGGFNDGSLACASCGTAPDVEFELDVI